MKDYIHDNIIRKGYNNTKRSYRRNNYEKEYYNPILRKKGWILLSIFWNNFHDNEGFSLPRMDITFHEEKWIRGVCLYSGLIPMSGTDFDILLKHVLPDRKIIEDHYGSGYCD